MPDYLIGIDLGGTNTKMMVMDTAFTPLGDGSIPTRPALGYEAVSDNIIAALEGIFAAAGVQKPRVLAVAMGLPGIVDARAQKTVYLSYVQWDGFNPGEKIARHFGASCVIDNDANVNVLGEYTFGIRKRVANVVLITLGTGVGCGVIAQGQVYHGADNLATELGHMTVVADGGEVCLCGKTGHLEAYCSGTALERYARRMMEADSGTLLHRLVAENGGVYKNEMVDRGILQGDATCEHIMARFVRYLAVGCGNMMKLFNPDLILLGGGLANAGALILDPLNAQAAGQVMHQNQLCPIQKAVLGAKAGMYGACALAGQSVGLAP